MLQGLMNFANKLGTVGGSLASNLMTNGMGVMNTMNGQASTGSMSGAMNGDLSTMQDSASQALSTMSQQNQIAEQVSSQMAQQNFQRSMVEAVNTNMGKDADMITKAAGGQ